MRKHETAVCGTARTVVWEVGKCENRRQMPFVSSIYLLPDCKETCIGLFVKHLLSVCKNTTNILIMQLWFHEECCFLNIR